MLINKPITEYELTVVAKDKDGTGKSSTAKVRIIVKDVNDEPPEFTQGLYKGVLTADLTNLREPINIKALDRDAESPNNRVVYNLVRSTYSDYFIINSETGKMDVRRKLPQVSEKLDNFLFI